MFTPGECGFCSSLTHFLRDCDVAAEYMHLGRCFRNHDHKIVLPNGQFFPRLIPGRNMAERIDKWLSENGGPPCPPQQQQPQQRPVRAQSFEHDLPPHTAQAMTFTTTEPVQTLAFGRIPLGSRGDKENNAQVFEKATKGKAKELPEVVIQRKGPARGPNKPGPGRDSIPEAPPPAPKPVLIPSISSKPLPPPAFKYQ
ncbi:hypothetical protein DFH09DRAFT_1077681 [Mycena vulgaris]|nr:hypothetical protein DFH09DRAFT_1077681 [Mycena vulgaris]